MVTAVMIGNKITQARKKQNLSQAQLAEQLFISPQAVGKWERGESMPDIITLNRLAEILNVDLNYFSGSFQQASDGPPAVPDSSSGPGKQAERPGWNMSGGSWVDADFSGLKNLYEKFSGSNMQRCRFIGSDLSGLELKGNYIESCDISESDMSSSRIQGSQISGCRFIKTSLQQAVFTASHIKGSDFSEADLSDTVFKSSSLQENELSGAVLNRTAFRNTGFVNTVIEGMIRDCSFENCDFKKVTFKDTEFINCFFKCRSLKKIKFENCRADNISYAFLKNGKAELDGISLQEG